MSYWETKCRTFIALQGYLNCKKWLIKNGKKQTKHLAPFRHLKYTFPYTKCYTWNPNKVLFVNYPFLDCIFHCSQWPSAVGMQSQLPFMWWSSITLKAMPIFLAEVKCLKHKCGHIPGTSFHRDLCMLPAAGGLGEHGSYAKHVANSAAPPCV